MQGYVQLQRRFGDHAVGDVDRDNWAHLYSSELYSPYSWDDVLGNRCTVIVGASGTGKSIEFKHQTNVLRENGKAAFFCRLEDLANLPLQSALEIGVPTELAAWLTGADEGWFFLDAIDEAKLVNLRQFEWAISRCRGHCGTPVPRPHYDLHKTARMGSIRRSRDALPEA